MKVFLSWSGARSRAVAQTLRAWLPDVVQSIQPFMSEDDIAKGSRGLDAIASTLDGCQFGVICLTKENKDRPWINFEAGAISKLVDQSRVAPLLVDLEFSDIQGPLQQFQVTHGSSASDMLRLLASLNERTDHPLPMDRLKRALASQWEVFEQGFKAALTIEAEGLQQVPRRDPSSMLDEILEHVVRIRQNVESSGSPVDHRRDHELAEGEAHRLLLGKAKLDRLVREMKIPGETRIVRGVDEDGLQLTLDRPLAEHEQDRVALLGRRIGIRIKDLVLGTEE